MTEPGGRRVALAPWVRRELPGAFTVEQTAVRVGHYKWIEMRIFELLGGWVATIGELEVKARLGTHCYHHAFHAELWHKRLPEIADLDPQRLTSPASPEVEALVWALGQPERADQTVEKLVGLYRVLLPNLIAAYTFHLNNTSEVSDAPTIRSLNLCLLDDMDEWREGEMMVQSLLTTPEAIDRAAARQAELAKLLLAAGGVVGASSVRLGEASLKLEEQHAESTGATARD
jgi:hypothetical protein